MKFKMNRVKMAFLLAGLPAVFLLLWGCQGQRPLGIASVRNMNVAIPYDGQLEASTFSFSAAGAELLYRVDGPGMTALKGTYGPFSMPNTGGSFSFNLQVPTLDSMVLSLQLNDASTHQPVAIGAAGLDLVTDPIGNVVVEMGSVTRNCYALNVPGGDSNETYAVATDSLINGITSGTGHDFSFNYSAGLNYGVTISDAEGNTGPAATISYLGNGDLVDFDYVPPYSKFTTNSGAAKAAPVSVGDIFCMTVGTVPGAHAWFQVVTLGNGTLYVGPIFRYRISTLPYFAYQRTIPDLTGTCNSGW